MTSTERRRTWSERLDPRNWSLVAKLAVVGLVPTVLALTIGAVRVVDQANVAEELGQGSGLVEAHQQVEALTQALQAERAAAVTFVGGNRLGDRNAVDSAQGATDQAVQRANDTLAVAQQQAPQLGTAQRQAETTLGQLPIIRSQVSAAPTPAADVTTRYTSVVQRTLALDRALLGQLQTSDTAGLATALGSTAAATEALELERSVLDGAIASSKLQEAQKAVVNGAEASYQAAASDYQAALTPQQADQFGNFATDAANANRQNIRDTIMATPTEGSVTAEPAAWNAAVDASTEVVRAADRQAEEQFVGGRAQAAEQAGNTAGLNSVLLMLGLILTIGIILLLGRQLVRSLRVLRTSALDVAERRLPQAVQGMRSGQAPSALVEPVPLDSRDEIGEVARAFDAVHGQAIRLAADQAALQQNVNSMFVNLSRRSQALVERQLQLIEQLESNEQDPDQLSNLFQLDHLATRMRRNSENLLVLAGTDLAKRNVAPVQVVDVLRAAVSEVEQYQRVVVQTPPSATIAGRAANDVVHLLAELLDNATNFSPPDSQVVMSTTRTADESLLIEIADRGVGMADSELADANQRLGGPSEVDVSASRRMGLFVVGRLAARHRIGVRLSSASGAGRSGGLSASVTVPPQLVPSAAPIVEQPRETGGTDEWGAAASGAWPVPADRQPVAANGAARNGSPSSAVAGADGPVAPTFGSGNATGPGRNGSTPKLPTRTPGSALRHNSGDATTTGSTGGQEAAPNGSSVRGLSAFVPSGPGTDGGGTEAGSDVFTPPSDGLPSGGYDAASPGTADAPRDERWPSGGRPGTNVPGHEGDHGADAGTTPGSHPEDVTGTGDAATATAPSTHEDAPARPPHGEADHTGRNVFGAAAAAGAGGALAGYFGRGGEPDGPSTEQIARIDDSDDTTPDQALAEGHEDGATSDENRQDDDHDAADAAVTAEPDTGEVATGDGAQDTADAPDDADASGTEDDVTDAEPPRATAVGAGATAAAGRQYAPDTDGDHRPVEETDEDDAGETVDADQVDDDRRPATTGPATTGPAPTGPAPAAGPQAGAPSGPAYADETAGEPDQESESDTTAFPVVRPPREPMGGARPAPERTGPPPPAPARRPVMPPTGSAPRPPEERPRPAVAQGSGRQDVDELFAPAVDVEGDRGQLRRPGGLESARGGSGYDISQTTPIFEEIASAWFRSNRSVPVRWQDGESARGGQENGGAGTPEQARPGAMPGAGPRPGPGPRPGAPGASGPPAGAAGPGAPAGNASPGVDDTGFASPADDVWRQAAGGADGAEQTPDELTSAGLPKRRPRARLLPGSAGGSTVLSPPAASEARNPENVRGRLASYQQGVRQGRESASGRTERTGSDAPEQASDDRQNPSDREEST